MATCRSSEHHETTNSYFLTIRFWYLFVDSGAPHPGYGKNGWVGGAPKKKKKKKKMKRRRKEEERDIERLPLVISIDNNPARFSTFCSSAFFFWRQSGFSRQEKIKRKKNPRRRATRQKNSDGGDLFSFLFFVFICF
jgi:hypothetical protein